MYKECNADMIRITLSRKLGEMKTGIRPGTINDLYHCVADRVSLDQLDKICEALDCDLSDILVHTPNTLRTVGLCESTTVYKIGYKG